MIFQRKKVASALAYLLGVGGAVSLIAAPSQAADIKVDVTGSNIKRVEGEGSLPVQVMTREEIDQTGATTAYDLLNFISANNSGGNVSAGLVGLTTFAAQTASLRGLGGQATLILINGKRVQNFAGELQGVYGVNLDTIPFAAIDRVEVLKDGASAVYGSDAVGGVINFIMKQDYRGYDVSGEYGWPTRSGGGDIWNVSATAGWGDLSKDKWNVFINARYEDRGSLDQNVRDFSKTNYIPSAGVNTLSGNTFPAYISTIADATGVSGSGSPFYPDCASSGIPGYINAAGRCRFDPAATPGVNQLPEQKITSFYASGRYQINPDWQAYLNGFYAKTETHLVIQPVPLSDQFFSGPNADISNAILLPPTSPYYPHEAAAAAGVDGEPLNVRYRCFACGLRDTTDESDAWQANGGVKGNWKNWDFDFSGWYAEGTTKESLNGGFPLIFGGQGYGPGILPLLNSGVVNVFGQNTPDVQAQIDATLFNQKTFDSTSKNYGAQAVASSDIWNLPAGPLGMAVGVQWHKEELTQNFNPALQSGDVSGYGGNFLDVSASRDDTAVFAEFNIPIVKGLEGTAAVRYDDYSDFGGTTNPKFSLRWNPVQSLLLRASWGTSFIAPSLTQLFGPQTNSVSAVGLSDPIRCPVTGDSNDCETQFGTVFGGNPNLQAEKSTQWQVGAVFEPVSNFSAGIDYFNIELSNQFSNGPSPGTILDPTQYDTFSYLVTRAPPDALNPNLPGRILNIDQRYQNLGKIKIQGFDVDLRGKLPATAFGTFGAQLTGTYYSQYDVEQLDGSFTGFVSNQYLAVATGLTPRWKHYLVFNWNYGPWGASLGQTFQSGYVDVNTDENDNLRRVGTLSIWDLQGTYSGIKGLTLTAGVRNLFDTDPPFTNTNLTFLTGYDPSYYDPRARVVYLRAQYAFGK